MFKVLKTDLMDFAKKIKALLQEKSVFASYICATIV